MTVAPVDVVVVAYGPPAKLAEALGGLGGTFPTLVVDNSSSPHTAAVARTAGATYVDLGENRGFAAGVNRALQHLAGTGHDVLLLNPDARIEAAQLQGLHRLLLETPDVACVAPAQCVPGSGRPSAVRWPWHTPGGAWAEAVGLSRRRMRSSRYFVGGAVLLLRRSALDDVGPFDERFFLYSEDEDWQRRAVARGWRVRYCPEITAEHGGGGTQDDPAPHQLRLHSSIERYVRKWHGAPGWWIYRVGTLFGLGLRMLVHRGRRRRNAARLARLYVTGPDRVARRSGVLPAPGA